MDDESGTRVDVLPDHPGPWAATVAASAPPGGRDPAPPPAGSGPRGFRWYLFASIALLLVVVSAASFAIGRSARNEPAAAPIAPATTSAVVEPAASPEPVVTVAETLERSVVQIDTDLGLGSGVIYDSSGLILTAAHVVGDARAVVVQLFDGSKLDGTVVGADEDSDVAVVRIESTGLVAADLAIDEDLRVGQMAIALGSPFGFDQSVTAGVVSATSRAVVDAAGVVMQLIQTDAPINPGNSGGPLANRDAQVIGINDQIISRSGGNDGVGFAIPIARAKEVADQLVEGRVIEQAFLGVSGTDPALGQAGGLVTEVVAGSPADEAGLESGDLVTAVDDVTITSFTELAGAVRAHRPGDQVTLSLTRNGNQNQVRVTLGGS
jgi:S1-C subfamily serine protease